MRLLWKLLRQHISVPQLAGFFVANLLGMLIILLSLQLYEDVLPVFTEDDAFIRNDYLIVSKRIGLMGTASTFSDSEVEDIRQQRFAKAVGRFTASQYKVACSVGVDGTRRFGTDMFFEAVPDNFVDADLTDWGFDERNPSVPIIVPRAYLAIYNFGFAQSHALPKLSEGVVSMVELAVALRGDGKESRLRGRIVGFSSRLNTILVPQAFMEWSNALYAPDGDTSPTRLIVQVSNPTDDTIARYMQEHGYQIDDDKLDAGKTAYFLRLLTTLVMGVGLLISALSFYILTLSIYLLVQKNTQKLENLLLIGYSTARVCLPYQLLTVGVNVAVLALALLILHLVRTYYMGMLWTIFPTLQGGAAWQPYALGGALLVLVSVLNVLAVRSKVMSIWNNHE